MKKIRVFLLLISCALLTTAAHAAAWSKFPALKQFAGEVTGHTFQSKKVIASTVTVFSREYGRDMPRQVDTELYADGALKFYARRGFADGAENRFQWSVSGGYVANSQLSQIFTPGSSVFISNIEFKDDRIELWLNGSSDGNFNPQNYGKVKLMLGKGYENMSYDQIVGFFARIFRVERIERVIELESEFTAIRQQIAAAQSARESSQQKDPVSRVETLQTLQSLYQRAADNRSALTQFGKASTDAPEFRSKAAALDPEITALREAATRQHQEELRARATELESQGASMKAAIKKRHPVSPRDFDEAEAAINSYRQLLGELGSVYQSLSSYGAPPPAATLAALERDQREAENLLPAMRENARKGAAQDIEAKYRAMVARRGQLQASYMAAFGSPNEASIATNLKALLHQMYENRIAAQQAGNKQAAEQARDLQKEIQKFR